jgi:gamma-glutamyltranspeptidase/glutathione hydrolase
MKMRAALIVTICGMLTAGAWGQGRLGSSGATVVPGRSRIATKFGIVAASQPLAARAGVQVLERGGNAVDAAIAANAVMGLVEPEMNGIGGDLFAIVYETKNKKLHGLNAGGWARPD